MTECGPLIGDPVLQIVMLETHFESFGWRGSQARLKEFLVGHSAEGFQPLEAETGRFLLESRTNEVPVNVIGLDWLIVRFGNFFKAGERFQKFTLFVESCKIEPRYSWKSRICTTSDKNIEKLLDMLAKNFHYIVIDSFIFVESL